MLFQQMFNPYMANPRRRSYIKLFHAVPNAPAVDVYANNQLLAENISYKEMTKYLPIPAGTYEIEVFPTGKKDNAVLKTTVTLPGGEVYTISVAGELPDISLLPIVEEMDPIVMPGMAYIRFSHLSPTAPNVDITLPDGTVIFSDVRFKETTDYVPVPPSVYTLQARLAGTDKVVLTVPNVQLYPNLYYSTYAVGTPGAQPPLELVTSVDGNNYMLM